MPQQEEKLDADFDSQLQGLFQEATQNIEDRDTAARKTEEGKEQEITRRVEERMAKSYVSVPQMLRPLMQVLEAVTRATGDNTTILQKLDKSTDAASTAQADLPTVVSGLQSMLEQKNGLNQRMFDALHEELKGYKDGFLLETVHKPIIRDLISLYDDLSLIHRQMQDAVADAAKLPSEVANKHLARLKTMDTNIEHNCLFIVEVLARLEVAMLPVGTGKLDKQTQRAVQVEIAEDPDEDGDIVKMVKRGFYWKDRVLRAEEVIIKKWKEGFLVALASGAPQK
ncbi:MAG: nucleotide exchange factor GrpE [Chthoniobacter sp.]|uniref:nucleotide exchange factor GrpE n=1 Tax=Chthoniobacter sp. TaxID=2510640 RepID=UPI0032A7DDCA